MDERRMAAEEEEDELWRTMATRMRNIEEEYDREWPRARAEKTKGSQIPARLDFSGVRALAHKVQNDHEERLARNQLRQPDLSPEMEDWHADRERVDLEEMSYRFSSWNPVPERQINPSILRGEQDSQNKVSYTE